MAGAAADDDWVHVAEEESDSDESFFSSTDSMVDDEVNDDDGDNSKDHHTVVLTDFPNPGAHGSNVDGETAAVAEEHGDYDDGGEAADAEAYYGGYSAGPVGYDYATSFHNDVVRADFLNPEAAAPAPTARAYVAIIGGETAVIADEHGDYDDDGGDQAADYGGGGYSASGQVGGYDYGHHYAPPDGYHANSFLNGVGYANAFDGNGGDGYATAAYYGYGPGYTRYVSYGGYGGSAYGYGYGGPAAAAAPAPAYVYGYGGGYGAPVSGYGYGYYAQDSAAMYQAPGYDPYAATTMPLEVRVRAPSWPPVFVGDAAAFEGGVPVYPAPGLGRVITDHQTL